VKDVSGKPGRNLPPKLGENFMANKPGRTPGAQHRGRHHRSRQTGGPDAQDHRRRRQARSAKLAEQRSTRWSTSCRFFFCFFFVADEVTTGVDPRGRQPRGQTSAGRAKVKGVRRAHMEGPHRTSVKRASFVADPRQWPNIDDRTHRSRKRGGDVEEDTVGDVGVRGCSN